MSIKFLSLDGPPDKMSLVARSKERQLFSQVRMETTAGLMYVQDLFTAYAMHCIFYNMFPTKIFSYTQQHTKVTCEC